MASSNKSGRAALARSKSIDQQIDEERERRQKEIQLLILGCAGSGKSTFIKQMRLHYGDGFPMNDRHGGFFQHIFDNITDSLHVILGQMTTIGIEFQSPNSKQKADELRKRFPKTVPISLCPDIDPENGSSPEDIIAAFKKFPKFDASREKPDVPLVMSLWRDGGVQTCYTQRKAFSKNALKESDEYFLENLYRISEKTFVPSIQDILYIRKPTFGVQEHIFTINSLVYRMIDVAGQRSQRKKWIHFFEGVTAVIYFASLSGFNEEVEEETTMNALQESLQTFHEVSHNHYLEKTDIVLFLNKQDIFQERIKTTRLNECFPNYQGEHNMDAYIHYIREQFLLHKPGPKQVYTHVSCATNVGMMKALIVNILDIIVELNLQRATVF